MEWIRFWTSPYWMRHQVRAPAWLGPWKRWHTVWRAVSASSGQGTSDLTETYSASLNHSATGNRGSTAHLTSSIAALRCELSTSFHLKTIAATTSFLHVPSLHCAKREDGSQCKQKAPWARGACRPPARLGALPQRGVPAGARRTAANWWGQIAAPVQVLDRAAPRLGLVHRVFHVVLQAFKVKPKGNRNVGAGLDGKDAHSVFLPVKHLQIL